MSVGLQGLGVAELAHQNAVAYARERLQGRALKGAATPDDPADPIIVHPDVRRMLMTMRAFSEGGRALAHVDRASAGPRAQATPTPMRAAMPRISSAF